MSIGMELTKHLRQKFGKKGRLRKQTNQKKIRKVDSHLYLREKLIRNNNNKNNKNLKQ